jgi:Ca2+/Na+ antiporter
MGEAYGLGPRDRYELWREEVKRWKREADEREKVAEVSAPYKALLMFTHILTWPTHIVLEWTIPDVKTEEKKHMYCIAFWMSMFWVTATSFVVCLGSDALHGYWGIPLSFLGLTLVSIGTSFPNLWASVITARQGRGPIAVSNALGSNVQNVFLVLAGPIWVRVMLHGTYVMGGDDIISSIIWMGVALSVVVGATAYNDYTLTTKWGYVFFIIYAAYIVQTTLSE